MKSWWVEDTTDQALQRYDWPGKRAYHFKHVLTQDVAYASLPRVRLRQLHACTAQALEALYAERLEEHYGALAHHYRQSGNAEQAVRYLQRAGAQALQRSAYVEAHAHLTTGLDVLATVPETPTRHQHELDLLIAFIQTLLATKGQAAPELAPVLTRAEARCQQMGEAAQRCAVLSARCWFHYMRAQYQAAQAVAEQLLALAQCQHAPAMLLTAHHSLGLTLLNVGAFAPARPHLEQGRALFDPRQHAPLHTAPGWRRHYELACRLQVGRALCVLGYPDQAVQRRQEGLSMAHLLAEPLVLVEVLHTSARIQRYRRA
jgi:tetratricopeptide (TPR) repeat protein